MYLINLTWDNLIYIKLRYKKKKHSTIDVTKAFTLSLIRIKKIKNE